MFDITVLGNALKWEKPNPSWEGTKSLQGVLNFKLPQALLIIKERINCSMSSFLGQKNGM